MNSVRITLEYHKLYRGHDAWWWGTCGIAEWKAAVARWVGLSEVSLDDIRTDLRDVHGHVFIRVPDNLSVSEKMHAWHDNIVSIELFENIRFSKQCVNSEKELA